MAGSIVRLATFQSNDLEVVAVLSKPFSNSSFVIRDSYSGMRNSGKRHTPSTLDLSDHHPSTQGLGCNFSGCRFHAVSTSTGEDLHQTSAHVTPRLADHSILRSPEQVPMGEEEPVLPDAVPFPHSHLPALLPTLPSTCPASLQSLPGFLLLDRWLSTWFLLTSSYGDLDQLHLVPRLFAFLPLATYVHHNVLTCRSKKIASPSTF